MLTLAKKCWSDLFISEFSPREKEQAYAAWFTEQFSRLVNTFVPIAQVFVAFSIICHFTIFPAPIWQATLVLFPLFIMAPLGVLQCVVAVKSRPEKIYFHTVLSSLCAIFTINILHFWSGYTGHDLPYEGVLLIIICIGVFSCLRAKDALAVFLFGFVVFTGVNFYFQSSFKIFCIETFFVFSFSLIGLFLTSIIERLFRTYFDNYQHLSNQANKDSLTGLFNRRGLRSKLDTALKQAGRDHQVLTYAMIDIDFFKKYNDYYGHGEGDVAIQKVACLLDSFCRRPLDCVARMGGEEFMLVLYGVDEKDAAAVLDALLSDVSQLNIPSAPCVAHDKLTISVGVTTEAPPFDSFESIYHRADTALYKAKKGGRNRVEKYHISFDDAETGI